MLPVMRTVLSYAALAPSGHNTQPWLFEVEGHFIRIIPDFERRLPVADPDNHALYISIGCALENLVLAAGHEGFACNVMYDLNSTTPSILVHLYESSSPADPLFNAITERHVSRSRYLAAPVEPWILQHLLEEAKGFDTIVTVITDAEKRASIAALASTACRIQFENPAFREELLQWIRFSNAAALMRHDGISSASMGAPAVHPALGRFFFRHLITANAEARKTKRLVEEAPALMLFAPQHHDPEGWVKLGRAFERVALCATRYGISHAHMNMPCEEPALRRQLQQLLPSGAAPLLLIRIGYATKQLPPARRRPIEELVSEPFSA